MIDPKFKPHLYKSIIAWHDWVELDKDMPINVEVIQKDLSEEYGRYLTVKRWLLIYPQYDLGEYLVAEFDIVINRFGKSQLLRINIDHLKPVKEIEVKDENKI